MFGVGEGGGVGIRVAVGGKGGVVDVGSEAGIEVEVGDRDRVEIVGGAGGWAIVDEVEQAGKVNRIRISRANGLTVIEDVSPIRYPF